MNYELAKELKEAGFPEGTRGSWLEKDCDACGFHNEYAPTLSELIEACGEKHYFAHYNPIEVNPRRDDLITTNVTAARVREYRNFALFHYPDAHKWVAGFGLEGQVYDLKGEGPTPEEAVARLWLALNVKQTNHG